MKIPSQRQGCLLVPLIAHNGFLFKSVLSCQCHDGQIEASIRGLEIEDGEVLDEEDKLSGS